MNGESESAVMNRVESKREFKARVLEKCRSVLALPTAQFCFADLARELGPSFAIGCPDERELRTALSGMVTRRQLVRPAHGRYAAGPCLDDDAAAGMTVMAELREAFYFASGIMSTPEILIAVGRNDEMGARLVRRALSESADFVKGLPFAGYQNHWAVCEEKRRNIPLRGAMHLIDLQITVSHLPDGAIPYEWGLEKALGDMRKRIGTGLSDARKLLDVDAGHMAMRVANAFERNLAKAPIQFGGSSRATPGEWWRAMQADRGRGKALGESWRMLEADAPPHIAGFLQVDFWLAVGEATGLDPAWLSRGCILHSVSRDPARMDCASF